MTQKQLINANNAELNNVKAEVAKLPMADDVKNGKYVWGKYRIIPPVTVSNPTFIVNKASGQALFMIVQASFDVTKIENWKDFFHNFENTSEGRRFNTLAPNPTLIYNSLNDNYTLTSFTPKSTSEGEFKIQKVDYMTFSSLFTYQGTKNLIGSKKEILSYVVSDEPTAYPDGGEKDGFWWERVKDVRKGILFESINREGFPTKATIDMDMDIVSTIDGFGYLSKIMSYLEELNVGIKRITSKHIGGTTKCRRVKVLRNCETIEINGFSGLGSESTIAPKVFIPNTVKDIIGYSNGSLAFQNANKNTKIYCESPSKPSAWDNYWNYTNASTALSVMWGVTEAQFDAL